MGFPFPFPLPAASASSPRCCRRGRSGAASGHLKGAAPTRPPHARRGPARRIPPRPAPRGAGTASPPPPPAGGGNARGGCRRSRHRPYPGARHRPPCHGLGPGWRAETPVGAGGSICHRKGLIPPLKASKQSGKPQLGSPKPQVEKCMTRAEAPLEVTDHLGHGYRAIAHC